MATNNIKRIIKEDGIVLEKIFKGATTEFRGQDGRIVSAQPDRYILRCVSGENFSKQNGYTNSTVQDYKVEKSVFDKCFALAEVVVQYEVSNYGIKAVAANLKEK